MATHPDDTRPVERRSDYISPRRYLFASFTMFGILALGVIGLYLQAVDQGSEQNKRIETEVQRNTARDKQFEALAMQNRAIGCAIARLVSYVPALQFEGEPQSNFVNWIISRQALLRETQTVHGCSSAVEKVLRERVALDQQVLDELERAEDE